VLRTYLGRDNVSGTVESSAEALQAMYSPDLPFELEELHPERNLSQKSLFQVVFALQNAPMEARATRLTLSPLQFVDTGTTRFDLEFHLWERSSKAATQNNTEDSEGISGSSIQH